MIDEVVSFSSHSTHDQVAVIQLVKNKIVIVSDVIVVVL